MKTKNKIKNYIAIVLDRSGSMDTLRRETIEAFNKQVETIRKHSKKEGHDTYVSLLTFGSDVRLEFLNASVDTLKPLDYDSYQPGGQTQLFDGVGKAITHLKNVSIRSSDDVSFLVVVITDGQENYSKEYGVPGHYLYKIGMTDISEYINAKIAEDNWTFAFQIPRGYVDDFVRNFRIDRDNIREWDITREGTQVMTMSNQVGLANYFTTRSAGEKSVKKFYHTTDLSNVKAKDIHKTLDDLSGSFKLYTVEKETPIKEFVEAKTKKPYVIGSSFYLLVKPEKIQANKQVLIMEKGKKAVWGGQEARDMIGLPDGVEAKVTPGNHQALDVYIASRSVNRLLPRGSKILVDVTKTKNDVPTWDHQAV